jgi:hypothetical protein
MQASSVGRIVFTSSACARGLRRANHLGALSPDQRRFATANSYDAFFLDARVSDA